MQSQLSPLSTCKGECQPCPVGLFLSSFSVEVLPCQMNSLWAVLLRIEKKEKRGGVEAHWLGLGACFLKGLKNER